MFKSRITWLPTRPLLRSEVFVASKSLEERPASFSNPSGFFGDRYDRDLATVFFSTVFHSEKRDKKRTKCSFAARDALERFDKKERAHGIRICFYFRGRGRHVTRSRRSGAFGNRRRGLLYIQINMAVRYWYGCTNISYWNFVILADCFILLLFYFSYFLHYSTPDVSARVRTFAIASYVIARYPFDVCRNMIRS